MKATPDITSCLSILSVFVIIASLCVIAVRFTPAHKAREAARLADALKQVGEGSHPVVGGLVARKG